MPASVPSPVWRWRTELSGAVGDLGITIPLAFALVATAGYSPASILLPWGLAYILTGLYYRVPVSIQPLKAMAVIVISGSVSPAVVSTAAVGYGVLFVLLAVTGVVPLIRRAFSAPLVRGVQLGIGLMLARKAVTLVLNRSFLLQGFKVPGPVTWLVLVGVLALLMVPRLRDRPGLTLAMIFGGMMTGLTLGGAPLAPSPGDAIRFTWPAWSHFPDAFFLLILPQFPLTLGNAVIAEEDVCRVRFGGRASRVTVTRLAASIGALNVGVGLVGGFPVCHGAGGSMAHARFGGRTGRTTIILGLSLIVLAIIPGGAGLLFLMPVPVLGALLLGVAWSMVRLIWMLPTRGMMLVAMVVGVTGLVARNLAIALAVGWILEHGIKFLENRREGS